MADSSTPLMGGLPPVHGRASDDQLLDHEYDGIREYDNPLPGWWVSLLWGTILFSLAYWIYYHFGVEGRSIRDQYDQEIADYAQVLIAKYGNLTPEPDTILFYSADPTAMAGMSSQFKSRCAQCHLADGGGNIGPNLHDDNYIHVKKVEDIYKVLKEGVVAKGMPAWEGTLSETQLVLMAAYVAQMRGSGPGSKGPEGDVAAPWPPVPASLPGQGGTQ